MNSANFIIYFICCLIFLDLFIFYYFIKLRNKFRYISFKFWINFYFSSELSDFCAEFSCCDCKILVFEMFEFCELFSDF